MLISAWGSHHHSAQISYTLVNADRVFMATQCTTALRLPGYSKKFLHMHGANWVGLSSFQMVD